MAVCKLTEQHIGGLYFGGGHRCLILICTIVPTHYIYVAG